jgi:hypothetical protein
MSLRSLFSPGVLRLMRDHWGAKFSIPTGINSETGQLEYGDPRDTGVQELAEEIYAIMATVGPIKLNDPVQFQRADGYTGPLFEFTDGEGPTISIKGPNEQTNIEIGGIQHTSDLALNNDYSQATPFTINEGKGDPDGATFVYAPPGFTFPGSGGTETGPEERKGESVPGRIDGGSGTTYTVDYYADGPFVAATIQLEDVVCLGAEDSWKIRPGTWVDVRRTGDTFWFTQPALTIMRQCTLTGVDEDTLDVTDQDGNAIVIAKPYLLRLTPFDGQVHNGIVYNFGASTTLREATLGATTEEQKVIPQYVTGDVVFAAWVIDGSGVSGVNWQDINTDGRAWAKVSP